MKAKEEQAEAESGSQGAFNEETGEINWDCPVRFHYKRVPDFADMGITLQCLGGMADGPCGEQFKAAFSCFVYSDAEPKGVECVEKFKNMQDCFRKHPDIYGEGKWTFSIWLKRARQRGKTDDTQKSMMMKTPSQRICQMEPFLENHLQKVIPITKTFLNHLTPILLPTRLSYPHHQKRQ